MSEPLAADGWIIATLKADSTLCNLIGGTANPRIYVDAFPQGVTPVYPYVLFQMQSAVDLNIVGPYRFWANMLYLVRGIAETQSYGPPLATIADRIDIDLHAKEGVNGNGTIWACVSEAAYRMPEEVSGRYFKHAGRIFRIYVTKL